MKSLTVVILLISFSDTVGLSCLKTDDGKPMELPLSNHDSNKIIKMIKDLSPNGTDDHDVCRVELYVNYTEQQLRISFTKHLIGNRLKDQDVRIDIGVEGDAIDKISIKHSLEYACSKDGCELEFVTNYTNWFIDADKPNLIGQLASYILGDDADEKGHCLNQDGTVEKCSAPHCVAIVDKGDDGKLISNPYCGNVDDSRVTGLWFIMKFNNELGSDNWWYTFRCNYDNCNDQSNLNNVISTFHKEYDIHSILNVFGYEDRGQEDMTTVSPQSSTSQRQTNPPGSSTSINSVTSTLTTSFFKPSSISSPVSSTPTASPVPSTPTASPIPSTPTASPVPSTPTASPVPSTPTASPIPSSTVTSSIESTTVTSPASNPPSNTAVTTIDGTTPKSNHALRRQSSNTVIYIALIIILSYLLFLL